MRHEFSTTFFFAGLILLVEASSIPKVTAIAKRVDSCAALLVGPPETKLDPREGPFVRPTSSVAPMTSTPPSTFNPPPISSAPPAALSCTYFGPEPPAQPEAFCSCGSSSWPLMSMPATYPVEASCSYTTPPSDATKAVQTNLNPTPTPTTNINMCQVCTPYAENEDSCQTIPNCVVQTGIVSVEAGSSPVHVGTLTSTALSASISSAVSKLCPSVTQTTDFTACATDSVTIGGISFADGGDGGLLDQSGELIVKVEASQYNESSMRSAMIDAIALTAMHSATGKNCYTASYTTEDLARRSWLDMARHAVGLKERDHPHADPASDTWCNVASFAGPQYFGPWWKEAAAGGATAYIDASWEFSEGPNGDFACEFAQDLIDALGIIEPEFAVGDIELGEAIAVSCELAMKYAT